MNDTNMVEVFGSVIVLDHNRKAVETARKTVTEDTPQYAYFYGPSGMGKTQLIRVIKKKVLENNPEITVIREDTNTLAVEFEYAVKKNTVDAVTSEYKKADLLILENFELANSDIVFSNIMGEIIEHFIENNKSVVLTSAFMPDPDGYESDKLKKVLDQFKLIELKLPSYEEKTVILKTFAQKKGIDHCNRNQSQLIKTIVTSYNTVGDIINAYNRSLLLFPELSDDEESFRKACEIIYREAGVSIPETDRSKEERNGR